MPDEPMTEGTSARQAAGFDSLAVSGLRFRPAGSPSEVLDAWQLVYQSYQRIGLIGPNPAAVHTVPHALQDRAVVICGRIRSLTVSTISGYLDLPDRGLPLDAVYPDELAELRADGRTLMEIGLFADRREHIERSIEALLELMRQVCYFGVTQGATDGVIGVHPHHAAFYIRMLGFERIGEEKNYSLVNDNPVILLRLDWYEKIRQIKPPRGLRYFRDNPLAADAFAGRVSLQSPQILQALAPLFDDSTSADHALRSLG